jgi:hypothetical protein
MTPELNSSSQQWKEILFLTVTKEEHSKIEPILTGFDSLMGILCNVFSDVCHRWP